MPRRSWVKLWAARTLQGSTFRELKPDERAVWFGFLCLAGDSPISGLICAAEDVPYTPMQLAKMLRVSLHLLKRATNRMVEVEKISVNGQGIRVTNWEHYQGDYERVRKHREGVTDETPRPPVTNETTLNRREKEKEKEKEKKEREEEPHTTTPPPDGGDGFLECLYHHYEEEQIKPKLSGSIRLLLQKMLKNYPYDWIEDAFKTAALNNVLKLPYIQTVLKNRAKEEGRGSLAGKHSHLVQR